MMWNEQFTFSRKNSNFLKLRMFNEFHHCSNRNLNIGFNINLKLGNVLFSISSEGVHKGYLHRCFHVFQIPCHRQLVDLALYSYSFEV